MRKMHRWGRSLLTVLFVTALAVLLIVSILMLSVVQRSLASFESYVISNRYAETVSAGSLFSQDLDALYTLMYNSLNSANLSTLRLYLSDSMLNYRYLEIAKLVESQLLAIETSMYFAENVGIYLPDLQRIITSDSIVRYLDGGNTESDYVTAILSAPEQDVIVTDDALICRTRKNAGIGQYRRDMIIYCRMSRSTLIRYLSKFAKDGDNLSLFIPGEEALDLFTFSGAALTREESGSIAGLIAGEKSGTAQYVSGRARYLLTWTDITQMSLKLCHVTPMEVIDAQMNEYRLLVVAVCALILLLLAGLIGFLYSMILRPLLNVQRGLKRVENGDLSTRLGLTWSREFQQIYGQFDRMTEHLQQLIEQEYELRLLSTNAELKQLRYQINPHFLYNAYFNLRAMLADEEYDQADKLTGLMGRYLRYITVSSHDFALLSEEMEHAAAYMEIQRMRFGSRVEIRMDELPAWAVSLKIPRLALQPLIENAFEHGVRQQEGAAIIAISLTRSGRDVSIFVDDNGVNAPDELIENVRRLIDEGVMREGTESVALVNIHKRMTLLYAKGSGLFVSRSALGGFRSEIRMKEALDDDENADRG